MKRLGFIAATVVCVVGIVGSATAAPVKKKYDAYVVTTNASATSFKVILTNDGSSQQTLGSADFYPPAGWTVSSVSGPTAPAGLNWSSCLGAGGTTCGGGDVVQLRAASSADALPPGSSVSVTISATHAAVCTGAWTTAAKQSNDFSGTLNTFTIAANDLTPLGGFSIAAIGTQTTNFAFNLIVTAEDPCGGTDADYTGGAPYTGTAVSTDGTLIGATPGPLNWANGVGTASITPLVAEIGNQLTVTDNLSGVTADSNQFDVVDVLCANLPCKAHDNPGTTLASGDKIPNGGNLGLGFNQQYANFSCTGVANRIGSFVIVDPENYGNTNFNLTLTYKKAISGSNPASGFIVCKSSNNGATWTALPLCTTVGQTGCIVSRKRVSGGDLQVVLSLAPGDPPVGGGFG